MNFVRSKKTNIPRTESNNENPKEKKIWKNYMTDVLKLEIVKTDKLSILVEFYTYNYRAKYLNLTLFLATS